MSFKVFIVLEHKKKFRHPYRSLRRKDKERYLHKYTTGVGMQMLILFLPIFSGASFCFGYLEFILNRMLGDGTRCINFFTQAPKLWSDFCD